MTKKKGPQAEKRDKKGLIIGSVIVIIICLETAYFIFPGWMTGHYVVTLSASDTSTSTQSATIPSGALSANSGNASSAPTVTHIATPAAVRAIYMTACAAADPDFRNRLVNLIQTSGLNSVVIDLKDYTGMISFTPANPDLTEYASNTCLVKDMPSFVATLHADGIYVVGRITAFQDPEYTKLHPEAAIRRKSNGAIWTDKNGLSYIDPASREAWNHIVEIATDAHAIGFDEINFDYIRYPSDGNVSDIALPPGEDVSKAATLESFFSFLHGKMQAAGITDSADLFGMTTTATNDMGIGQVWEGTLPYFDYLDPMVYPSHYPATFNGWPNPNAVPYDLITYVLTSAIQRTEATTTTTYALSETPIASTSPQRYTKESYNPQKVRPWLQDFTLGDPPYTATKISAQIQATENLGLNSWFLWDAGNLYKYTADAVEGVNPQSAQ